MPHGGFYAKRKMYLCHILTICNAYKEIKLRKVFLL